MDKNEYKVRLEEIKGFFEKRQYQNALTLVQTINWQKVKNARVLCMVADIYSENGLFTKAEAVLAIAVERGGSPKEVLYRLTKVAIDKRDFETAIDYNRRFIKSYPEDSRKYLLKFMLHRAQGAELSEQIDILEPYRNVEAPEPRWLYTLATLYEQIEQPNKLVAVCDEIFLWFHDGDYVLKALELKKKYSSLTEAQQRLLDDAAEEEEENIDYNLADSTTDYVVESEEVIRNRLAKVVGEITDPVRGSRLEEEDEVKVGLREFDVELDEKPVTDLFQPINIPEEPVDEDMIPGQLSLEECIRRLQEQKIAQEQARLEAERLEQEARERLQAEIDSCREQIEAVDAQVAEHEDAIVGLQGEKKRLQEQLDDLMTREVPVVSATVIKPTAETPTVAVAVTEPEAETAVEPEAETAVEPEAEEVVEPEVETVVLPVIEEPVETSEMEAEEAVPSEEPAKEVPAAVEAEEGEEAETTVETEVLEEPEEAEDAEDAENDKIAEDAEAVESTEVMAAEEETIEIVLPQTQEEEEELPTIHNPYLKSEHLTKIAARLERRFSGGAAAAAIVAADKTVKTAENEAKQAAAGVAVMAGSLNTSGIDVGLVEETLREEEARARRQAEERAALPTVSKQEEAEEVVEETTEKVVEEAAEEVVEEAAAVQAQADQAAEEAVSRAQESLLKSLAETRDSTERMIADIETDVKSHTQEIRLGARGQKKDLVAPIGVKSGEDVTPLTEEQKRTLGYFGPVQGIPEQVATVLDEIHKRGLDAKTSSRGNIIVMGRQGSGKTTLAVNVLKAIEQEKGNTNSPLRVATIDAQWLNDNDVAATIDQIAGGGLIIERASELNDETIEALATGLGMRTDGLTVILEDNKKNIAKLMERNEEFANRFTSQILVPIFTNHELVSFGRTYALEQGYAIEDKALLELYTLIGDMQRDNQPVTVNDVKEVMDDAIEHASRFRLFKKRKTDKDGFIILTENDFE